MAMPGGGSWIPDQVRDDEKGDPNGVGFLPGQAALRMRAWLNRPGISIILREHERGPLPSMMAGAALYRLLELGE
jgi:hypothetical protein